MLHDVVVVWPISCNNALVSYNTYLTRGFWAQFDEQQDTLFKIHFTNYGTGSVSFQTRAAHSFTGAKLKALRHKRFHIYHFIKFDMVFGIIDLFSLPFSTAVSEKRKVVLFFPPTESCLAYSDFSRVSCMQGEAN